MKVHLLIIIFLFSIKVIARDSADSKRYSISACFTEEIDILNVGNLNNYLESKGYYVTPNSLSDQVFGLCLRDKTIPWYIKAYFYRGETSKLESYDKSHISLTGTRLEFLYDLIKNDKWTIAPLVGIQTSDYELQSSFKNGVNQEEDFVLASYVQKHDLYQLRPGLSIDRKMRIFFLDIFLGIQMSYIVQIGSDSWHDCGGKILNSVPATNLSGFSFGLTSRINIYPIRFSK